MKKLLLVGLLIATLFLTGCGEVDLSCDNFTAFYNDWIEADCPGGCAMDSRQLIGRNGCCMNVSLTEFQNSCN